MANIRESAGLRQRLAVDDVGHGGDGRKLSPDDNGGPSINESHGSFPVGKFAAVVLVSLGSGAFLINSGDIMRNLEERGFTLEQFIEALRDAIRDALS